ncbi:MAG: phosphate signaling complex protein PhoU [Eubacteriales bacterium]|nr:phosphate signaling complex protein PhoU [Eubacteriales bacterium]
MRSKFDEQLENLHKEMVLMGMLCETAIKKSAASVLQHEVSIAEELSEILEQIKKKEREIEHICLSILLQQQPVARDLRVVSSALKMVTDMERVGVQSTDIAEIVCVGNIKQIDEQMPLRALLDSVIKMVTESIDAFVKRDMEMAKAVVAYDDVVDGYFKEIKDMLIDQLRSGETDGETLVDLLMIVKYLEKIGDHAVNIAGWVIFSITGQHERIE